MKLALLALALVCAAPLAQAQIVIQPPSVRVGPGPGGPPPPYWRGREGDMEWRRRQEFREAEHRRMDWRRAHCVRDYSGAEYCRR